MSFIMNNLYTVKLPEVDINVCVCVCLCAGVMDVDLDGIIQCIKQGDEHGVHTQLQQFNKEVTHTHI